MKKLIRNRKGLDPVLSSLLLLTVAIAAMSLVVSTSQAIINGRRDQITERLQVEMIQFKDPYINIFVRNTGHVDILLKNVIVNYNQSLNSIWISLTPNCSLPSLEGNPQGQSTVVTIQNSFGNGGIPGKGFFTISFFSSNNNEIGKTEVGYDENSI